MNKIKVMLADDHVLLRNSLAMLINMFGRYEIIGLAANGKEVIQLLEAGNIPRLIVLDLSMPVMDGYETAKILREKYPQINILILTLYGSELVFLRLLKLGVKGIVQKDINNQEFEKALLQVSKSQYYYSNADVGKLSCIANNRNGEAQKNMLNDIEIEFLRLSSSDLMYKEIADKMNVTPRKIDHLRDSLFEKLEVKSRVGLAMYATKNGIVFLDN